MDDYKILLYIIAAVIYFITKAKKKKPPVGDADTSRPGTENNHSPQGPTKTFEDLLKEITGETEPEEREAEVTQKVPEKENKSSEAEEQRLEGERRAFADEESRRVYEESIKRAEGFDIEFSPDENFKEPRLFKGEDGTEEEENTFADEIRDGLSTNEAKKAIIYSEILNRKY